MRRLAIVECFFLYESTSDKLATSSEAARECIASILVHLQRFEDGNERRNAIALLSKVV